MTYQDAQTRYYFLRLAKSGTLKILAPFGASKGCCPALDITEDYELCINAGLFNPHAHTYEPEGVIIVDGVVVQNSRAVYYPDSMPLTIDRNGKLWYASADADAHELVKQGIVQAVCGFMPIIIEGKAVPKQRWTKVPHYDKQHQRQIIGQFQNGDYAVITCEGRGYADSSGWTIEDAQRVCIKHGLDFAYNLDGGTSTETVYQGNLITSVYDRAPDRFASTFITYIT